MRAKMLMNIIEYEKSYIITGMSSIIEITIWRLFGRYCESVC